MPACFPADDLDAMQQVRDAVDPQRSLQPGKVLPTPRLCGKCPVRTVSIGRTGRPWRTFSDGCRSRRHAAGTELDSVDGVIPRQIAEPESGAISPATLASASSDRAATVRAVAGPSVDGAAFRRRSIWSSRRARLNDLLVHRHGDLTATVHARVTLVDLNRCWRTARPVVADRQRFDAATIGRRTCDNDAGPLRHRFGTPRDLLIGVTLATTDGGLVKRWSRRQECGGLHLGNWSVDRAERSRPSLMRRSSCCRSTNIGHGDASY